MDIFAILLLPVFYFAKFCSYIHGLFVIWAVADITPPPTQPISLRLDNVLPVVNPRHVQLLGPQVCICHCFPDKFLQCFDAVGWVAGRASGL